MLWVQYYFVKFSENAYKQPVSIGLSCIAYM